MAEPRTPDRCEDGGICYATTMAVERMSHRIKDLERRLELAKQALRDASGALSAMTYSLCELRGAQRLCDEAEDKVHAALAQFNPPAEG